MFILSEQAISYINFTFYYKISLFHLMKGRKMPKYKIAHSEKPTLLGFMKIDQKDNLNESVGII